MRITRQKDIFANANRHYSLRKLSVGLASVLIGLSFANATKIQTVKADSLNKVPVYLRGNENTVQNEMQQFSSVQNSVAEQPQKDLHDDLSKQRTSMQSNDHAEVKNQENRLVDQSNNKLTNNTSTDSKEDLEQNLTAPDETKQDITIKSDAEKSIVGSSSTQQVNNQSNNHAEDNSQTQPQNEQKLDLTKNSPKFAKKVLATNLTQDNSSQDISKITDPSKIDASHFADGTHWTPAGWTRLGKDTKIAKSSKLDISWGDPSKIDSNGLYDNKQYDYATINVNSLTFTINKDDLQAGNKILLSTIQQLPSAGKQSITPNTHPVLVDNNVGLDTYAVKDENGNEIGYVTNYCNDQSEYGFFLNVTKTENNLVADPTFNIRFNNRTICANPNDNGNWPYDGFYSYKNHLKYPLQYSLVTNSSVLNYKIDFDTNAPTKMSPYENPSPWYKSDPVWGSIGRGYQSTYNQVNPKSNINLGYVDKITVIKGQKPTFRWAQITTQIYLYDANNQLTNSAISQIQAVPITQADNNLSSLDLWNMTPDGQVKYSNQADGSILLCNKENPSAWTANAITQQAEKSYLVNVQDPDHAEQIINNTINNTKSWATYVKLALINIPTTNQYYAITDVTPSISGMNSLGSTTLQSQIQDITGSSDLETYKNVNISYVDDDDNSKSVSSDSMTGRQNKASTYTVNIPKGYYLDDNNTSTGYTWNTDHTQITYTFNADQAKNDANPIEIHLKHKIQDVSATDPKAKQDNRYRVIENLPDGTKKTIIDLEIESHRTATKDLVTGKTTYSDWISKDAVFTNRTNNGGSGDPSFIWTVPLDRFDNCTRTFSIPNGYEKVEQNDRTFYTSPEKDNNGSSLIYFISHPDGGVGLDFEVDVPKNNTTTYKAMPANCDFVINYQHNTQKVTDPSQLQTTGKRTITIKMPKGHGDQMTIIQTVGYKRTGTLDLYTGKTTYTDWVFDADTSNVTVNGQPSTQYQAYVLKDGVVNYAPIKLPHINGYKSKLIQDKTNPAMFLVSFMALPQQNNQSNNVQSSQKTNQAEQKQPEPVQTAPATKQTKAGYKPVLQTVRPNMLSFIFMPIAKPPVEVNLDTPEKFSVNDATVSLLPTWHLVENNMPAYTYTLTNTINSLNLPKIKDYKLYLVNKDSQDNTVAFTYLKDNNLKYLFKIKFINDSFEFSVKNVDKDVIRVYKFNNLKDLDKFLVKFVTAA